MSRGFRLAGLWVIVCAGAAAVHFPGSSARAEFTNNQELFLGTVLDSVNWEAYPPPSGAGAITQNNGLAIDTTGAVTIADYTTRYVKVPIGGSVSATINVHSVTPSGGGVWLFLSNNSTGPAPQANLDSKQIQMWMPSAGGAVYGGAGSEGNGYGNTVAASVPADTPFVWTIERFSATSGRFSVHTTGGQLVGSHTDNNLTWPNISFDEDLFIVLQSQGANAEFKNVSYVPEPVGLSALLLCGALLARRRT